MPIEKALTSMFIFNELDEADLQKVVDISMVRSFRSRTNVFLQGEERHSVYFINRGIVKIYRLDPHGNENIISFLKEGDMFPHAGFFDKTPYPATAEVMEDTELCVIPIRAFEKLIMDQPELAVKIMGQKIRELQSVIQELSSSDVQYRICSLLLRLADAYGEPKANGVHLTLKLTNSDMAKMVGTTRETINRFLNKLKKDGILTEDSKHLIITNRKALEELSGSV